LETNSKPKEPEFWKNKIKEHRNAFIVVIIAGICAAIGAILVFIWFIETSDIGLRGTATFDQWSLAWIWGFMILLILWELLFVGVPVGLFFGVGGYIWWKRLPDEEKQEIKERRKEEKKHRTRNAGGFGFFMFIAYTVYIAVKGQLFTPFGNHPYSYWLYAYLWTIAWMLIVLGIPAAIILIIVYFTVWRKRAKKAE
jgi:MFS family permease